MRSMEYDSSDTDDDVPPPLQSRFRSSMRPAGNGRAAVATSAPIPRISDMEIQIHNIEQEAYRAVLRAFKAQSDAITWVSTLVHLEKEGLITELRKELRVSDEEHRELLSRVNNDDMIRTIREWRKTSRSQSGMPSNAQPGHDRAPSPSVSASRKKQKTSQSVASLSSMGAPSPTLHPPMQASTSALRRGPAPPSASRKKPQPSLQYPSTGMTETGRGQVANRASSGQFATHEAAAPATFDPLVGRKVWTRWPEDNNFYEALITDFKADEGRHALVYDMGTSEETWEWVDLKEIPAEDIRWEGEHPTHFNKSGRPGPGPGPGRGNKKPLMRGGSVAAGAGRGKGNTKGPKREFPLSQNGTGKKTIGDIEILHTETLIKEVEKVFGASLPDPMEIEKAKKVLQEHEQALVDAIARLEDASDGVSEVWRALAGSNLGNSAALVVVLVFGEYFLAVLLGAFLELFVSELLSSL
ncbi:Protein EMSY-LIKE 3 [Linum grandiflorum]